MNRFRLQKVGFALCAAFATTLLTPQTTNASGILYQFDTPFPGDPNPAGSNPWLDASFQNVSGGVLLTVTNLGLTTGEFLNGNGNGANGGLFFNINPADNVNNLVFTLQYANGTFGTSINQGENSFKADGDGKYDIVFDFTPGAFTAGSSFSYLITGISGLTANDFAYLSASTPGESGPFYAAAHVAGIPGGQSTWLEPDLGPLAIPVPEPSSAGLLLVGMGAWGAFRQWRKRKI